MSWTKSDNYATFREAAREIYDDPQYHWELQVWEVTDDYPAGRWYRESSAAFLQSNASLRIMYSDRMLELWMGELIKICSLAPTASPSRHTVTNLTDLFAQLHIPSDFTSDYTQAICHGFSHRTQGDGDSCAWFHFLCKSISVTHERGKLPSVAHKSRSFGGKSTKLPNADYAWIRSSFFLQQRANGSATLVCFGATTEVVTRIEEFTERQCWDDVLVNPYILFDVVIDGLYYVVDSMVWNMNIVFGPMEHKMLEVAHDQNFKKLNSFLSYAAIHNCAKHIVFLNEVLESCVMAIDQAVKHSESALHPETRTVPRARRNLVQSQLTEIFMYRRTRFRSTQLRLASLQKRVDNIIALAFNLVAQQGSMAMMQDSRVMKAIAAITIVFLPTTGVATVLGSQLFISELRDDKNGWTVSITPLFWITLWVSIPLTLCVIGTALLWQWWLHNGNKAKKWSLLLGKVSGLKRSEELEKIR